MTKAKEAPARNRKSNLLLKATSQLNHAFRARTAGDASETIRMQRGPIRSLPAVSA